MRQPFAIYNDGKDTEPKAFEDDGFIHIKRGKYRVTYEGKEKEIPMLVRMAKRLKLQYLKDNVEVIQ